jgi:proteasome lid subunit RPN8/RPN11
MAPELAAPTLRLRRDHHDVVVAHCYDGFPEEACGLLAGPLDATGATPTGEVSAVYPCENAAHSARIYQIGGRDLLRATLDAARHDAEIVAVWHSHTHTDPYPSRTDVEQAMEAQKLERPWLYVIVSLRHGAPAMRAYWILEERIHEVAVEVVGSDATPGPGSADL